MRHPRLLVGAVLLAMLSLFLGGGVASAASGTVTYQGHFEGTISYDDCQPTPPVATTTGTWSVTLHGASAKAVFDILVNGEPHVAYTFPGMKQTEVEGTTFAVHGRTQAGVLTVTLYPAGSMTYVIAPYTFNGLTCTSVTYPGHLG